MTHWFIVSWALLRWKSTQKKSAKHTIRLRQLAANARLPGVEGAGT